MTAQAKKMKCPQCGVEMNYQAEKLVYPSTAAEAKMMDPALGGIVEDFFTCPECGKAESRHAS